MDDSSLLDKGITATVTRFANLLSGRGTECIHCGQSVEVFRQDGRCVYAHIEDESQCTRSIKASLDGEGFWCRQYQGRLGNGE